GRRRRLLLQVDALGLLGQAGQRRVRIFCDESGKGVAPGLSRQTQDVAAGIRPPEAIQRQGSKRRLRLLRKQRLPQLDGRVGGAESQVEQIEGAGEGLQRREVGR